jgi:phospholipid/cholesterol/gamma-HCH transport system substrate-binding protein
MVVTTLATGVLVVTIGNLDFGTTREYRAVFTDATGVVKGDDIRIAGVKVGTVKKVEIADRTRALVTFSVQDRPRCRRRPGPTSATATWSASATSR